MSNEIHGCGCNLKLRENLVWIRGVGEQIVLEGGTPTKEARERGVPKESLPPRRPINEELPKEVGGR